MASQEEVTAILQRLFDWTYNSMAAYILESQPHIPGGKEELLLRVGSIAEEHRILSDDIARVMREFGAVPHIHPHDPSFAELNFLSIDFLCSVLDKKLGEYIVQLDKDLAKLNDDSRLCKPLIDLRESFRQGQMRLK